MTNMTIKIKAKKKIATESLDHTDPRGAINDNSTNPSFINELQNYYNDRVINFMDVGCAGGQFVIDMSNKSFVNYSVGVEGSDTALRGSGSANWKNYQDKNLFFCDASHPYSFVDSNEEKVFFDLIFSTDVIEHIPNESIDAFVDNMYDSLSEGGMIVMSIGLCRKDPRHVTHYTPSEWEERLSKWNVGSYPFKGTLRGRNSDTHFLCLKK